MKDQDYRPYETSFFVKDVVAYTLAMQTLKNAFAPEYKKVTETGDFYAVIHEVAKNQSHLKAEIFGELLSEVGIPVPSFMWE
ncbi:MAG TPA: hypothetical protein VD999_05150 [Vitreimonas sp.]|nr:hypothetical protein [Vitreimonas sp.]